MTALTFPIARVHALLLGRPTTMIEPSRAPASTSPLRALALAAALFIPLATASAQDESPAEPADPSADSAAVADGAAPAEGDAAVVDELPPPPEPVAAPVGSNIKPNPAEMSPFAIHGLLLDITYTGERLIAVGERGNILVSRDGIRWAQVNVPTRATLTGLSFVDTQRGWAVGHDAAIIHTADGGRTWSLQAFNPELEQPLHDVFFADTRQGFAFGSFGLFWQTADGGKTWTEVHAPTVLEEGFHLNGMTRLKDGQFLIVGESGLLGLSADGINWERLESPYEGSYFGVLPRGEKGALIYGMRGNAYVTDDVRAGQWRKINLATISSMFGAYAMGDGSIILVGADAVVLTVQADETVERVATYAGVASSGTITGIVRHPGGLMTVGESGVQPYQTKTAPTVPAVVTRDLHTTDDF